MIYAFSPIKTDSTRLGTGNATLKSDKTLFIAQTSLYPCSSEYIALTSETSVFLQSSMQNLFMPLCWDVTQAHEPTFRLK